MSEVNVTLYEPLIVCGKSSSVVVCGAGSRVDDKHQLLDLDLDRFVGSLGFGSGLFVLALGAGTSVSTSCEPSGRSWPLVNVP